MKGKYSIIVKIDVEDDCNGVLLTQNGIDNLTLTKINNAFKPYTNSKIEINKIDSKLIKEE